MSEECGGCSGEGCPSSQPRDETPLRQAEDQALARRMDMIKHKIVVLSGKGGVGKSAVAAGLAVRLLLEGKRVGLLDIDIHGPSVPTLLGLQGQTIRQADGAMLPVEYVSGMHVMSIGFMLPHDDDALIWRGPMKAGVIQQFLRDVDWGELDYLIVDSPPGTGDEPLSVIQSIGEVDGVVIVTTPQTVALADVRKSVTFCRKIGAPILGVVENMSGFVCPHCSEVSEIFGRGGGERMAQEMEVPFLARLPLDPDLRRLGDDGKLSDYFRQTENTAQRNFARVVETALALESRADHSDEKGTRMRIAIPLAAGKLCMHFGHCEQFALVEVEENTVKKTELLTPPAHAPGVLPQWLAERKVDTVIAGGMGSRAQGLFAEHGIAVVVGAPADEPTELVRQHLAGRLVGGDNVCDH